MCHLLGEGREGLNYGESSWRIAIKVNGVPVSEVVDTASEITIIAQWVYDWMSPRQEIYSSIDVNLTRSGATIAVGSLGNALIEIGGPDKTSGVCCSTSINMLLGIDFSRKT